MKPNEFFENLSKANHYLEQYCDHVLVQYGLSHARWQIIEAIIENGEKARPSIIASRLGLTKATITSLIKALEKEGCVGRRPCVKDGRQICVFVTPKGKNLADRISPALAKHTKKLFEKISNDQMIIAVQIFNQIQNNKSQSKGIIL